MLISEKYKYIFISIPKTGTTAIQDFLLKNDPSCISNHITLEDKHFKIDEHIKTKKLKRIMGERFYKYTVFTFIRDPYSRGVSGYFFYKNGDTLKSHYLLRNLMAWLNTISTKILPFVMWSLVKPQKKLVDYFCDDSDDLLIDLVGKTENLNGDLLSICRLIGIPLEKECVPLKNTSSHLSVEKYFSNKLHRRLYKKLMKKDIELYQQYENQIYTEKYNLKYTS